MGRQPRQRPISCHFCRVRKLRCSRVFPCSNCTARGIPCPDSTDPQPSHSQPPAKKIINGSSVSNTESDILSRLERLEALLAERTKQPEAVAPPQEALIPVSSIQPKQGLMPQEPLTQPLSPKVQNLTAEALFLERNCLGPKLIDISIGENITFRTCPIRLITQTTSSYVFQNPNVPLNTLLLPTKCIWLPQREEMKVLVDKYIDNITYIRHVMHSPTLRALIDEVYDDLEQGKQVSSGTIVLFLSIASDITYSWTVEDQTCNLFGDCKEANSQSIFWLKAGLDLLDNAQRCAHLSIECIQGIMILCFVVCNLEGISIRARSLVSKAVLMGRELGLHRIDHPNNGSSSQTAHWDELKLEVGRRVWWYLASTDWLMARFPGPHEGTYTVHPKHMFVKKPLNINDEALTRARKPVGLPLEQPTCMSYFLQRVRLAEVSRQFMDRMWLEDTDPTMLAYDVVQELDKAIEGLLHDAPSFLILDYDELDKIPPTDPRRSPAIIVQRHVLNLFVYGQRCKLHLPYLVRGTVDATYARSRQICLQTAKIIVDMENRLEQENIPFVSTRLRLTVALHSVFLAAIVLLIDLCLGTDTEDKSTSRELMTHVWRIMDAAQEHSLPAAKLQELLKQVMKKHKVSLPVMKPNETSVVRRGDQEGALPLTPASGTNRGYSTDGTPANSNFDIPELENFDARMDLDGIDWNSILWELDAPVFV